MRFPLKESSPPPVPFRYPAGVSLFLFVLQGKFGFCTLDEASDVLPVAQDHEEYAKGEQEGGKKALCRQEPQHHGTTGHAAHGGQGHVLDREQKEQHDGGTAQPHPPVQEPGGGQADHKALASLEAVPHREGVAQHGKAGGQGHTQ